MTTIPITQLSKRVQAAIKSAKGLRAFVKPRGSTGGWTLRLLSQPSATPKQVQRLIDLGYQEVQQ